ncbi:MAG: AtpZ/AtpI family protein, partial [Clostridia bacterium]|nr:AtpZ/AtpI family protein [Deltaproteobacteria bacterium]
MAISSDQQRQMRLAFKYSAVGIEMAACVAAGTLGGRWLDEKFGTAPWMLAFGIVVGFGAAFRAVQRVVREFRRDSRTHDKKM